MNMKALAVHARKTWQAIAAAPMADRARLYWAWCQTVTAAQENGGLTIKDAASLLIWPEALDELEGLADVADILIVLDTADAITEGAAYVGAPDNQERDWRDLVARVSRHAAV